MISASSPVSSEVDIGVWSVSPAVSPLSLSLLLSLSLSSLVAIISSANSKSLIDPTSYLPNLPFRLLLLSAFGKLCPVQDWARWGPRLHTLKVSNDAACGHGFNP